MDKPDIDAVHAYLISLRPFTPQQFIAIIDKAKEDELEIASTEAADPRDALFNPGQLQELAEKVKKYGFEIMPALAADPRYAPFTPEQLQELAEKVKKYGFEITPALAADLQRAARYFRTRRREYHKTLRLSEERKNYEAFRDLFAELTKRFRYWNDLPSRHQFVYRITNHYCQAGKELDEAFCDSFAKIIKLFRSWDHPSSKALQFDYQRVGHYWQAGKKLDEDSGQYLQIYTSLSVCVSNMLIQAAQLSQALYRFFTDVLYILPEDEGGRPKNWPLHTFILELKEIWEKGTAKKAGRSRNPRTQEIKGPFVRVCLTYLEPDNPYPSLGETIHKVLQAETVTRNGKNLPKN